jgi:hypothetical protein
MKKIISVIVFLFAFLSVANCNEAFTSSNQQSSLTVYADIIKIEYVCIDGQWYKITYYSDETIKIQGVQTTGD